MRYVVDYDRLNEGTIGRLVRELDPDRAWWPSSPSGGPSDFSDNWHGDGRGDMHFWSVWHEGKSFSEYLTVNPRFCSEFGFQSFPRYETVASFAPEGERNVTSPAMEHHQRHSRGNTIILETMSRYFRMPSGAARDPLSFTGPAGLGDPDRRRLLEEPAPAVHGHAVLAAERRLARLELVEPGLRRELETPPL